MKKIKNLTPHVITAMTQTGGLVDIPPYGVVARLTTTSLPVETLEVNGLKVGVFTTQLTDAIGLPPPEDGVVLIVSMAVRQAYPDRLDLLSPGELIRDETGQPIACQGFVQNLH